MIFYGKARRGVGIAGLLAGMLTATGLVGCGESQSSAPSTAGTVEKQPQGGQGTGVANALGVPGSGKGVLGEFGRAALPDERAAIESFVERGLAACVEKDDPRCPIPVAASQTREIRAKLARGEVVAVRVKGDNAIAVYTVAGPRWSQIPVRRVGRGWAVGEYGAWSQTG